ncbi:MAG: Na/Pi cotransporter family protein [Gammaproteobacteria bacterium]|nr:Na/Pi cotransporter family protein [Gammaproteobacteria bacterium]MBU1977703.1 Na/Pi cotransporter family protein [Gammaproteobacteria bacterium]
MSTWTTAGGLLGGIGLFLLGMGLMTDGLKLAAGPALERILAHSTKTRLRGLASGVLVTALVQSSSAVTVAAIGFVNAGLLTLGQSMWVLFGANVGTTMTGWLVALVGLKFKIEVLALPLIGIGMALRLSGDGKRRGALGQALAGFGVLFLGIDMLKESFSGLSANFSMPEGEGIRDTLMQVLIGIALTVLMQSSSASLTIALTAAQGGLLTAQGAAAMVIGANIGTTVTALIASIGATPNAKRAAAAHILFNLLTGAVALALLPWLVSAIGTAGEALELGSSPAAKLALFHTTFNLLGVILIWPIAERMVLFLGKRFHAAEEDEARPRYLDANIATVPALALNALEQEVRRMGGIALRMMREAMAGAAYDKLARDQQIVTKLNQVVADFISRINQAGMSQDSAQRLPHILRVARYYEAVAELAMEAAAAARETPLPTLIETGSSFLDQVTRLFSRIDPEGYQEYAADVETGLQSLEGDYQILKTELLEAGAQGRLPVADMDARLRAASAIHRAVQQAAKAARLLVAKSSAREAAQE